MHVEVYREAIKKASRHTTINFLRALLQDSHVRSLFLALFGVKRIDGLGGSMLKEAREFLRSTSGVVAPHVPAWCLAVFDMPRAKVAYFGELSAAAAAFKLSCLARNGRVITPPGVPPPPQPPQTVLSSMIEARLRAAAGVARSQGIGLVPGVLVAHLDAFHGVGDWPVPALPPTPLASSLPPRPLRRSQPTAEVDGWEYRFKGDVDRCSPPLPVDVCPPWGVFDGDTEMEDLGCDFDPAFFS